MKRSLAGVKQTNAIAEPNIRIILAGGRTALLAAGLPSCYWTYAMPCWWALNSLIRDENTGVVPYEARHGEPFKGMVV